MADLFAEVDELMRQERLAKIWKDYGGYILTLVIGVILATAVVSGYKAWNRSVRESQTEKLLTLQNDTDYPANIAQADLSDMRGGLRGVAYLSAADAFLKQDKPEDALSLYEKATQDKTVPREFAGLADLMIVRLSLDKPGAQAVPLLERLERILNDPQSPWANHARLEAALIEAHLNGDYKAAQERLNTILDAPDLPKSLYEKARALKHIYELKEKGGAGSEN